MSNYTSHLVCFGGCAGQYSLYDVIYSCPKCGGLLEVQHDLDALRDRSPAVWMQMFDQRSRTGEWPYGSGVWGMREWVVPDLLDENVVSMFEGNTNLFQAQRLGKQMGLPDLWIKMSGNSHTGSFKDLGMTVLVSVVKQMMSEGSRVRAVACASTGDTSAALAAYAAFAGIPAIVFLPRDKVTQEQLIQPVANGAHVLALDTDFDGCMKMVREISADHHFYLANSMNSLRIEGQKSLAIEIVRQFGWSTPDWIVLPVGNLGNISALYSGFRMLRELGVISQFPRLVAAQAGKSNPFYQSYMNGFNEKVSLNAETTLASAIQIGDPVSYDKAVQAIKDTDGVVEQASENELANAAAMGDMTGMYTCPHTGVALAVLDKLLREGVIQSEQRVVVVSTAHGLKFTSFKSEYHKDVLEDVESEHTNPVCELPADIDVVKQTIEQRIEKRLRKTDQ